MSDVNNLRIQQQINEAIEQRGKILAAQTKQIADQAELAIAFCKAMKCDGIDEISERIGEIRAGLEAAAKAAADQADSTNAAAEATANLRREQEKKDAAEAAALKQKQKDIEKVEKQLETGLEFLGNTFSFAFASIESATKAVGNVASGIFNIGKALINIPLKVFDLMLGKAAEVANASYAIATAIEDVREQFGDVNRGLAKDVVSGGREIGNSLSEAGLSIGQAFGLGPEGAAAAIRESNAIAKDLGATVSILGESFKKSVGDLFVFRSGLGLTNEDLKSVVKYSKSVGTSFRTEFLQMGKIAVDMGKKFSFLGISSKDIARDMAFLTTSSGKFGRVTKEAMAAASVTVRSYGLELKDVVGILDQFADFESAATTASKFAQSFGTILDPIKLMKEENPAKAFEYLRNQMLAAGQSAETMNKAQIKQLATLSGMDENNVRLAFSNKNVGKSYEQIQKEAEKSGKKQKSQQEIMQDLGNSIKRVVEAITHSGSLMSEFFSGFGEGIARSEKGRKVLYDLASLLREVRHLGREVGKAFTESFPGVGKFFDGLHEFLKVLKGPDGINKISSAFTSFFKMLSTDPEKSLDSLQKSLEGISGGSGAGFSMMVEGAKAATKAIVGVFAGLVRMVVPKLIEGIDTFTKILSDPKGIKAGFAKLSGETGSMLKPLFTAIVDNAGPLWESIKKMFSVGWEKYGDSITSFLGKVVLSALFIGAIKAAAIAVIPMIGTAIAGSMTAALGGAEGEGLLLMIARKIVTKGSTTAAAGTVGRGLGIALGSAGVGIAAAAAISASDIDKITGKALEEKLASGELKNAGAASGGKIAATLVNAITLGFLSDETYTSIAESTASMFDGALSWIRDNLGWSFGNYFELSMKSAFSMFSGIGDLILGLFSGDTDRIGNGIFKILRGIFEGALATLNLPVMFIEYMILASKLILKGLVSAFVGLGKGIHKLFVKAFEFVSGEGLLNLVNGTVDKLIEGGKSIPGKIAGFFKEVFSPITELFSGDDSKKVTDGITTAVTPDVKVVTESIQSSTEQIKAASLENLSSIQDEALEFSKLDPEKIQEMQKNLNSGIENMQKIVAGIDNKNLASMKESISNIDTGALSMFGALVDKIDESAKSMLSNEAVTNLHVLDQVLLTGLENVMNHAMNLGTLSKEFADNYQKDIILNVRNAVDALNNLDHILSDVNVGDIDTTIRDLNSRLIIGGKKIQIENKPININMSLNIQFDSLKFTESVFTVADRASRLDTAGMNAMDRVTKQKTTSLQNTLKGFWGA
jgi:hypothetical protein